MKVKPMLPLIGLYIGMAGSAHAKVVDIHVPSPSESQDINDGSNRRDNERAQDVINDPDASPEDKIDAIDTIINNGAMV